MAVLCAGYREARFNCAWLIEGRTCGNTDGIVGCIPAQPLCTPEDFDERCQGDSLLICSAAYQPASVSCVDLGFARCGDVEGRAMCMGE